MTTSESSQTQRAGFVALVGLPNVGKSTLVNALTGQKVAIVSPKPQTTRTRITAIVTSPAAQVVLVDTPGLTGGGDALRRAMRRITQSTAATADLALVVVEATEDAPALSEAERDVIAAARLGSGHIVVALNKVDRVRNKAALLPWIEVFARLEGVDVVVPISATRKDGLDALMAELESRLPVSPRLFPEDMVTDQAERVLCAELVREQLLLQTRQEVPHSAAVVIEVFEDGREGSEGGTCHIEGRIIVEREAQKGIVVGKGGQRIKSLSEKARMGIEELLACRVYLRLTVHVDKNWRDSERALQRLGYGFDHE